jgi:tetratricopeptide (TPR) repeat protein
MSRPAVGTDNAVVVEPAELTRRPDLVGKEISVDDRVALFQFHPGRGFDEIALKRTPVVFRLPPRLRYRQPPGAAAARVQGVLKREGDRWVCDVTGVDLMPKDRDRLERAVQALPPTEYDLRGRWAVWAERRGRDFKDEALLERGRALDAEALRIEADRAGVADRPTLWLSLAQRARDHELPEPEPSALAHRALRARLASAHSAEELRALIADVARFFPRAAAPTGAVPPDLAKWEAPYAAHPADGYRAAPAEVRTALDHRLWADATERLLQRQASNDPKKALALADQASAQLPDRPEVAETLTELGLGTSADDLGSLRLGDVESLAKLYRERLKEPQRARKLLRDWLDEQRKRHLSPTDAEGRVALAGQYERLLGDRDTAVELLQSAWDIDPQSKEVSQAFRSRGFRKVNDEWVDPARTRKPPAETAAGPEAAPAPATAASPKLLNLTPQQVRALLGGKPNRISRSASQGQVIEQWIYTGPQRDQYVNFLRTGGSPPRVVGYYSLPSTSTHPPQTQP